MADTQNADRPRRLRATPARQGRLGRDVLVVLVVSTALALIALFGSWAWNSNRLAAVEPSNNAKQPAEAQSFQAPEPAPIASPPSAP